jgi:hypothetical protein
MRRIVVCLVVAALSAAVPAGVAADPTSICPDQMYLVPVSAVQSGQANEKTATGLSVRSTPMAASRADLTIGRPCRTTSCCSAGRLHHPGKEDPPGHHAGVKLARVTAWRSPADLFNGRGGKRPVLDGPLPNLLLGSPERVYFRSKVAGTWMFTPPIRTQTV